LRKAIAFASKANYCIALRQSNLLNCFAAKQPIELVARQSNLLNCSAAKQRRVELPAKQTTIEILCGMNCFAAQQSNELLCRKATY
jgi:hypothetical protein